MRCTHTTPYPPPTASRMDACYGAHAFAARCFSRLNLSCCCIYRISKVVHMDPVRDSQQDAHNTGTMNFTAARESVAMLPLYLRWNPVTNTLTRCPYG